MFWRRKKEFKYYRLEELKVGMRVQVRSLEDIFEKAIYLDRKTFKHDKYGGSGVIVAIGLEEALAKGIKADDVYTICNAESDMWDEPAEDHTL